MKKLILAIFFFVAFFFLLFPSTVRAQGFVFLSEKINSYDSLIEIQKDRSLLIHETINVTAENINIKRGIYRDFPTSYTDPKGKVYRVGFEVLSVKRDGNPEAYHLENESNGIRIYIGDPNTYVSVGDHTYEIYFKTTKQLGLFDDHDELYFNAIGTGWVFPIIKGMTTIVLPSKFKDSDIQTTSFTGYQDSVANGATVRIDNTSAENTKVIFQTTSTLQSNEGLTIVVGWPKGYINYPTAEEIKVEEFLSNLYIYVGILGLFLIFVYYLLTWLRFGKEPSAGVIIPEYTISDTISPGMVSYIDKMGFNNSSLIANIVNLARKKIITIKELGDNFELTLIDNRKDEVSEDEKIIVDKINEKSDKRLIFFSKYSEDIYTFLQSYRSQISSFAKRYFKENIVLKILGVLLSGGVIFLTVMAFGINQSTESVSVAMFSGAFVFILVGIVPAFIIGGIRRTGNTSKFLEIAFGGCFIVFAFFLVFFITVLLSLNAGFSPLVFLSIVGISVISLFGLVTLGSRTKEGRLLQDKIEGLKMYIKTAETERLKFLYKTFDEAVQNYEKILPYAMALGLELEWTEKFNKVFDQFKQETGNVYISPAWYFIGNSGVFNPSALSSNLSNSISSSTVAPGSSSGFSGGGFSGGGGGGGGGGGW